MHVINILYTVGACYVMPLVLKSDVSYNSVHYFKLLKPSIVLLGAKDSFQDFPDMFSVQSFVLLVSAQFQYLLDLQ